MPSHTVKERLKKRIRRSDAAMFAALARQEEASAAQKRERDKQAAQTPKETPEQVRQRVKKIGGPKEKAARLRQVAERVEREEERRRRLRKGQSALGLDLLGPVARRRF